MRAAGVQRIGSAIQPLELPEPTPPAGQVLLDMHASYPLAEAAAAMARLQQGTHGAAVVLEP